VGNFRDLEAWRTAREFALLTTKASATLPVEHRFALADQWRRASYSVVLNIAEGAGRRSPREFSRYLTYALGSLDELEAILDLVRGMECLPEATIRELEVKRGTCARLVRGLLRAISGR
jgi:four helix bundle protein